MLNLNPSDIVRSGRVGPGKILAVDTKEKGLLFDKEVKENISSNKDFIKTQRGKGIFIDLTLF